MTKVDRDLLRRRFQVQRERAQQAVDEQILAEIEIPEPFRTVYRLPATAARGDLLDRIGHDLGLRRRTDECGDGSVIFLRELGNRVLEHWSLLSERSPTSSVRTIVEQALFVAADINDILVDWDLATELRFTTTPLTFDEDLEAALVEHLAGLAHPWIHKLRGISRRRRRAG